MLIAHNDFKLLSANTIWRRPHLVVLFHYLRVFDDALKLVHYALVHVGLLANKRIVFVVGIVRVAQFAVGSKLEFEKFVAEFAFVADVVAQIKVFGHVFVYFAYSCIGPNILSKVELFKIEVLVEFSLKKE